jgi:hypothetical protein
MGGGDGGRWKGAHNTHPSSYATLDSGIPLLLTRTEYLQYAGCIKATVIEAEHCGGHYSTLVAEVSQENVRKANLCW